MEEEKKSRGIGSYAVVILNGMAQGLFASLIIGLIIKQIGTYAGIRMLTEFGQLAQYMTGPAIVPAPIAPAAAEANTARLGAFKLSATPTPIAGPVIYCAS